MRVEVQTRGVELSRSLEIWLKKKVSKFDRMEIDGILYVTLRRNYEKGPIEVDLLLQTDKGTLQTRNDGYHEKTALSRALQKIEQQLIKFKKKRGVERHRKTSHALQELKEMLLEGEQGVRIRRGSLARLPLYALDEAFSVIDGKNSGFLLFRDVEDDNRVKLLIRERDDEFVLYEF